MIDLLTPRPPAVSSPRAGSALRIVPQTRPTRAARPAQSADEQRALARDIARQACLLHRLDAISDVAREALKLPEGSAAQDALWNELATLRPAPTSSLVVEEDSLWLLRRMDGSLIDTLRLRGNHLVGPNPDPNMATWRQTSEGLLLTGLDGTPGLRFVLSCEQGGRRVLLGVNAAATNMVVLSELKCLYSRLRMIDPELTNPMAGLFPPDALVEPELPEVPVVVLAAHRTGSHLLINLLNSSGRVFIDGEILNAGKISLFGDDLPADRKDGLDMLRISDPVRFAKVMMGRSFHTDGRHLGGIAVRGFKLFPEHARNVYDWALDHPTVRIVHLYRDNLLAEFSSYLVAMRDGHWVGGPDSAQRLRILFDRDRFLRFVDMKQRYLENLRGRLASRAAPSIDIEYSQIARSSVNRVLSFLLDEPVDAPVSALGLKQQLNERVIERFVNPDEVLACLAEIGQAQWAGVEMPEVDRL